MTRAVIIEPKLKTKLGAQLATSWIVSTWTSTKMCKLASWLADKLWSKLTSWLTNWQAARLTRWQKDKVTEWQFDMMTRWQDDKMTTGQDDNRTRWQNDDMTWWQKLVKVGKVQIHPMLMAVNESLYAMNTLYVAPPNLFSLLWKRSFGDWIHIQEQFEIVLI